MSRRPLTAVGCILEKYAGDALPAVMPVVAFEVFAGTLKWDEPHAGYGFPLPSSQRDRYEGKDRLL